MKRREIIKNLSLFSLAGMNASTLFSFKRAKSSPQKQMPANDIYAELGVKRVINGRGTITIIGGCRMLPEVQEAMEAATKHYVELDELADGVGEKLGQLTGTEWGMVTTGAAGGMVMATAAVITRGNPDRLWQLPNLAGLKDEVIIPSYSWTAYGPVVRGVGVKMITVNTIHELEDAIGPQTAMVLILAGQQSREGPLSTKEIAKRTKPKGIPILIDAAAEGLFVPNPHIAEGADLVVYSGGKVLRGPQCSGLLLGKKDLVRSAWMASAPHHGFARGYKVGREEIMGMFTAAAMWFKRDRAEENKEANRKLDEIRKRLKTIPYVTTEVRQPSATQFSNAYPGMSVEWDIDRIPLTGEDVEQLLWEGDPRVAVSGAGSFLPFPPNMKPNIRIDTSQLNEGEERIIAERVFSILSNPPSLPKNKRAPEHDLGGLWDLELKFEASTDVHRLVLEQTGNMLKGTHFGTFGDRDIEGNVNGNEILFYSSFTRNGARINFKFTGKVKNKTEMGGNLSLSEYGKAEWKATRHIFEMQGSH